MRVLVVEDDPEVAGMIRWCLELADGVLVDVYPSAEAVPTDDGWDAALVDWRLGEANGCEFAQRLRVERPGMTVVVWTADDFGASRDPKCRGCTVLPKPSPPSTIREALGIE